MKQVVVVDVQLADDIILKRASFCNWSWIRFAVSFLKSEISIFNCRNKCSETTLNSSKGKRNSEYRAMPSVHSIRSRNNTHNTIALIIKVFILATTNELWVAEAPINFLLSTSFAYLSRLTWLTFVFIKVGLSWNKKVKIQFKSRSWLLQSGCFIRYLKNY